VTRATIDGRPPLALTDDNRQAVAAALAAMLVAALRREGADRANGRPTPA
jgi:hypothetical protein